MNRLRDAIDIACAPRDDLHHFLLVNRRHQPRHAHHGHCSVEEENALKHAREDYDRIQDPSGKIPADEPVFLIRGQDRHAAEALRFYAKLVESPEIAELVRRHADAMDAWPVKKEPDL